MGKEMYNKCKLNILLRWSNLVYANFSQKCCSDDCSQFITKQELPQNFPDLNGLDYCIRSVFEKRPVLPQQNLSIS